MKNDKKSMSKRILGLLIYLLKMKVKILIAITGISFASKFIKFNLSVNILGITFRIGNGRSSFVLIDNENITLEFIISDFGNGGINLLSVDCKEKNLGEFPEGKICTKEELKMAKLLLFPLRLVLGGKIKMGLTAAITGLDSKINNGELDKPEITKIINAKRKMGFLVEIFS